jgi:hypothetical protein
MGNWMGNFAVGCRRRRERRAVAEATADEGVRLLTVSRPALHRLDAARRAAAAVSSCNRWSDVKRSRRWAAFGVSERRDRLISGDRFDQADQFLGDGRWMRCKVFDDRILERDVWAKRFGLGEASK